MVPCACHSSTWDKEAEGQGFKASLCCIVSCRLDLATEPLSNFKRGDSLVPCRN